jgi:glycosyltransferase involved in cell wall biosynthesis
MGVRFGVLSTYPTTQCGIATFAQALVGSLLEHGAHVGVVRIVDEPQVQVLPVVHQWVSGRRNGAREAARALDDHDVVVVQHEYGIFGGDDGQDVLDVVALLHVPVITVLHTVLTRPTAHQHEVLAQLCAASDALVTMTETARGRLVAGWDVDPARVHVITHGAVQNIPVAPKAWPEQGDPVTILTWGLLGDGKGIEWALRALAGLGDLVPAPRYSIVGQTHPRVREREGEVYRDRLVELTRELGLERSVRFDAEYLPGDRLRSIVRAADVVLLPYDSKEQVTSGVLIEAVAAGRPVISSRFPHAIELLGNGAGLLVPQRDPAAIGVALRRVLTDPQLAQRLSRKADALAPELSWLSVAGRYIAAARPLARRHITAAVA